MTFPAQTYGDLAMARVPDSLKVRVTFTRSTPVSDPSSGTASGGEPATITGTAIGAPGDVDQYLALGLVQSKARTLLFVPDTAGESPEEGDAVLWAGLPYAVKTADPIEPAATALGSRVVITR